MKLIGISKKGKERIKRDGDEWIIIRTADRVVFSTKKGPWLFINTPDGDERTSRWIHASDDENFKIIKD